MQTNNRETWLNQLTSQFLAPHFEQAGYTIPANVRMACSLTSKKKHIGECWSSIASQDNHFEIMIVPSIADSSRVADILIHELCHAVVGIQAGHGKAFKQCALAVGLEGKMTATIASEGLKAKIAQWVQVLGEYPHAPLMQSNIKKQSTRMIKCVCLACDYQVYTSNKWIEIAMPTCPNDECDQMGYSMNLG
jgi:hypothetical protein